MLSYWLWQLQWGIYSMTSSNNLSNPETIITPVTVPGLDTIDSVPKPPASKRRRGRGQVQPEIRPFVETIDTVDEPVVLPECQRCGFCCTVDLIPIERSKLTVEGLFLIESRNGRVVTIDGHEGLYLEYPLRCKFLTSNMLCALWDTPIRPAPCEKSGCLNGRVKPADLGFLSGD